jgi:pyridoxine 5-phosphate synthase
MQLKLGVNIDHVATLRQVRHAAYPDPIEAARLCAEAGAHSLTVHLREDRRHIQDRDVWDLKRENILPLNLEMGNAPEIVRIALEVKPREVCVVPERRQELTTEGGLDVVRQERALRSTVESFRRAGVVVSLFVEPDLRQLEAAARLGVSHVELHTGAFCGAEGGEAVRELGRLIEGARAAHRLGLRVNAGHGISLRNAHAILRIPHLETLNIGHSVVARAVMVGMQEAVAEMMDAMEEYRGGEP